MSQKSLRKVCIVHDPVGKCISLLLGPSSVAMGVLEYAQSLQYRYMVLGLYVCHFLPPLATSRPKNNTNGFSLILCSKVIGVKTNEKANIPRPDPFPCIPSRHRKLQPEANISLHTIYFLINVPVKNNSKLQAVHF